MRASPPVVPYLTREAVAAIGARSATGSGLAVTYQSPSLVAALGRRAVSRARRSGPMADEPWRSTWTPTAMADLLRAHGLATAADDLLSLASALRLEPKARRSLRNGRVAVAYGR